MAQRTEANGFQDLLVAFEQSKNAADRADLAARICEGAASRSDAAIATYAPLVPRFVGDAQSEVRCAGLALAAAVLSSDEVIGVCTRALRDDEPRVRVEAAGRLADLARPDVRGVLAAGLQDEVFEVRFEAARGMAALHHPAGFDVLVDALGYSDLRFQALGALAELGDDRAIPEVRRVFAKWLLSPFERTQAAGVLARFGQREGVAHLKKRVAKRWAPDQAMAVEFLCAFGGAEATPLLQQILSDLTHPCLGAAARGAGRGKRTEFFGDLRRIATDDAASDDVRLDALEGALHLETPEAFALARAVTLKSPEAREELAEMVREFESGVRER